MNTRYLLSVLLITVLMVAGIYAYFQYLANINSPLILEKAGTGAPPGEQDKLGTQRTEAEKIDILKELAKTEVATTTQKQKTSTVLSTTTIQDAPVTKERTSILKNLAATSTTSLSNEDKLKILNSLQ